MTILFLRIIIDSFQKYFLIHYYLFSLIIIIFFFCMKVLLYKYCLHLYIIVFFRKSIISNSIDGLNINHEI